MRPLRLSLVSSGFLHSKNVNKRKRKTRKNKQSADASMPATMFTGHISTRTHGGSACNAMLMDDVGVEGTHIMLQ